MSNLLFANPVFSKGVNTTVRRGDKYATLAGDVSLLDTEGNLVGIGNVTGVTVKPFNELDKRELRINHDPACRTKEGLLAVMQQVYPGFVETETISVVFFEAKGLLNPIQP